MRGREPIQSALDLAYGTQLAGAAFDEAANRGVRHTGLAGDLAKGVPAILDSAAELLGEGGDVLHSTRHNVRFIERSSVRISARANNRPPKYLRLMPRPFSHVVADLKEAIGSYDRLEAFFDGNPVKSTWSKWGRGDGEPGARLAKRMADVLGCSRAEIRGEGPWPPDFLDRLKAKADAKLGKAARSPVARAAEREVELVEGLLGTIDELRSGMRELLLAMRARLAESSDPAAN